MFFIFSLVDMYSNHNTSLDLVFDEMVSDLHMLGPNNPVSILQIQIASQLARLASMYSASAKLSATECCFLLNHEIIVDPELKKNPKVLFLSITLPFQSEYVYPCNCTMQTLRHLSPKSIVLQIYLKTCFSTTQCVRTESHPLTPRG
jgi:hypothetical protein